MKNESNNNPQTKATPYDALLATGRVYIVKVSGGHYEDRWEDIEGVFSTYKKAKNYRRKRKRKDYACDKEHTIEIIPFELDKPCC